MSDDETTPINLAEILVAMQVAALDRDVAELDALREAANGLGDLQQMARADSMYHRLRASLGP